MKNIITVGNYSAKIKYDPSTDLFRGEILGLSGGADFTEKRRNSCAPNSKSR